MKFIEAFKKIVQAGDFFHSAQLLRYQTENQYRTTTGGIISIAIIVVILVGFARMIIDTVNLSTITYTLKTERQTDQKSTTLFADPAKNFMFGIEIAIDGQQYKNLNLSSELKYFDLQAIYVQFQLKNLKNYQIVDLQVCKKEHWANVDEVVSNFDKLEVSNWLCPKIGSQFPLYGKYSGDKAGALQIFASKCRNETNNICHSDQEIEKFFNSSIKKFDFSMYYTNVIINPDQPNYLSYFLEDKAFISFGTTIGTEAYLSFKDFKIKTDNSIWPFQSYTLNQGFMTTSIPDQYPFSISQESNFFSLYLVKGDISYEYNRQVQKISSVFSFIGGLISAIVAVLFVINNFTSFSFEVSIGIDIFKNSTTKQQKQVNNKEDPQNYTKPLQSPNILQFLQYYFYILCSFIKKKPQWHLSRRLQQMRRQALNQLDITLLLKRIIFIQNCLKHLFEDYQLLQLRKTTPINAEQMKMLRDSLKSQVQICTSHYISTSELKKSCEGSDINSQCINVPDDPHEKKQSEIKLDVERIQENNQESSSSIKPDIDSYRKLELSSNLGDKISFRILKTLKQKQQQRNIKERKKSILEIAQNFQSSRQNRISLEIPVIHMRQKIGRNLTVVREVFQ